jgi:hypothetical protein
MPYRSALQGIRNTAGDSRFAKWSHDHRTNLSSLQTLAARGVKSRTRTNSEKAKTAYHGSGYGMRFANRSRARGRFCPHPPADGLQLRKRLKRDYLRE